MTKTGKFPTLFIDHTFFFFLLSNFVKLGYLEIQNSNAYVQGEFITQYTLRPIRHDLVYATRFNLINFFH